MDLANSPCRGMLSTGSVRKCAGLALAAATLLVSSPTQAQDSPPPAHEISPAAALHISPEGFRVIGDSIKGALPTGITAIGLSGEFDCGGIGDDDDSATGDDDDSALADSLQYSSQDIDIHISADEVVVSPGNNRIDISMAMTLWSDPAAITLSGSCLIELDEVCTLGLQPTALNADVAMQLALVEGELQAQVDSLSFSHGNFGNPIETGCLLGDVLETLQSYNVDLIGGILGGVLDEQVAELQTQLEDALGGLTETLAYESELDLLGATVSASLTPNHLELSETGMLLEFGARFSTPSYGDCVPQTGAYPPESHDMPALTGLLPDSADEYHLAIVLNEDTLNQALYAAWQGGAFCIVLTELSGLQLSTDYLALVESELVEELWPEPQPLDIRLEATSPPRIALWDEPHLDAELVLDVFGEELDRKARFWGLDLLANATFGITLEDSVLAVDIGFDIESNLGVTVSYNEWLPPRLAQSFSGLLPDLAGQVIDLESLAPSFTLPQIYGISIAAIQTRSIGIEDDYLAVYGWFDPNAATPMELGTVDLGGVGCGDTSSGGEVVISGCEGDQAGCASTGCDSSEEGGCSGCDEGSESCSGGGCSAARSASPSTTVLLLLLPLLAALRRRP